MNSEPAETGVVKRQRGRPSIWRSYYGSVFEAGDRIAYEAAEQVEGLTGEKALLRMKVRGLATAETPREIELMTRVGDALVRMLVGEYRISKEAQRDIASNMFALIRGMSLQFYPEPKDDA